MISIVIAVALAALRIAGHKSEAFQAAAHLFVGYLIGGAYWDYQHTWTTGGKRAMDMIWIAVALSIIEVACALWFKFGANS